MRILFVNHVFPGVFGPLAACLGADPSNEVLFMSSYGRRDYSIPGVHRVILRVSRNRAGSPPAALPGAELDRAYKTASQAFSSYQALRRMGFAPDLALSTAPRGYSLFLRDAFPEAFLVGYDACWRPAPAPAGGLPPAANLTPELLRGRHILHSHLYFTYSAARRAAFPAFLRAGVHLVPYSADTDFFSPERARPFCAEDGTRLDGGELVSFRVASAAAARDRKLWQIIRGILLARPRCHVVILCGGDARPALEAVISRQRGPDSRRLHLRDFLPLAEYRDLLCATTLHICPDKAGLPSTEVLEAMSCRALLVLPPDPDLRAIVSNGRNAFVLGPGNAEESLRFILSLLDRAKSLGRVRQAARKTVLQAFRQADVLPRHAAFILREYADWKNPET